MALNKNTLQAAIKTAFEKARNTPPPADPAQAEQVQKQILDTLSADLANAILAFVTGGDVVDVVVQVKNTSQVVIGTGAQTAPGKIQ